MKPGPELASWLSDPLRQAQSEARTNAFALSIAEHRLLRSVHHELQAAAGDPDLVRAVADRFMNDADQLRDFMREMVREARQDSFFSPPFRRISTEINAGLLLYDDPSLQLNAGVMPLDMIAAKKTAGAGRGSISFPGFTVMIRFLDPGGAILSFWEADPIPEQFASESCGPCRMVGRRAIAPDELLVLDGRHQSFVIEHATSDIVHMQAVLKAGAAPVAVEYDANTCAFLGATSTDEISSRTQMMLSLLRILDHRGATDLLLSTLEDPNFYTRWHAMRELLAHDADAALPPLRRMAAADPHPDIRSAARATLSAFFSEEAMPCPA